jgi:hypothetical protein
MHSDRAGQKQSSMTACVAIIHFFSCRRLVGLIALSAAFMAPSQGFAQISLGAAGGYDIFEAYNGPGMTGNVYASSSTIFGNVGLSANTSYSGYATSIGGTVYEDNAANVSYNPSGPVGGNNGVPVIGSLAQASADALSASKAAAAWGTTTSANVLSTFSGVGNFQVNGSMANGGRNVVNFANFASIGGGSGNTTITINGTSNEQFVFNFANGGTLTQTTIILNGVSENNVFFNIVGGSFSAIGGSTINGMILNMGGGGMSIDNDFISGEVVTNGFVDMAGSVIAPEMPTIMMAGLAGLLVFGHAGLNRLRSRRQVRPAVSEMA